MKVQDALADLSDFEIQQLVNDFREWKDKGFLEKMSKLSFKLISLLFIDKRRK
jgi:hypothetical protein